MRPCYQYYSNLFYKILVLDVKDAVSVLLRSSLVNQGSVRPVSNILWVGLFVLRIPFSALTPLIGKRK